MTNDEIKALALQAGMAQLHGATFPNCAMTPEVLERFARACIAQGLEMGAKRLDIEFGGSVLAGDEAAHELRDMAAEMLK